MKVEEENEKDKFKIQTTEEYNSTILSFIECSNQKNKIFNSWKQTSKECMMQFSFE